MMIETNKIFDYLKASSSLIAILGVLGGYVYWIGVAKAQLDSNSESIEKLQALQKVESDIVSHERRIVTLEEKMDRMYDLISNSASDISYIKGVIAQWDRGHPIDREN